MNVGVYVAILACHDQGSEERVRLMGVIEASPLR